MSDQTTPNPGMPQPHPSLKELDKFVGKWSMSGHLVGSDDEILKGEASYEWLEGGFFLKQHVKMTFMGMSIDSTELVGYDPETDGLKSFVYSNMSPVPLPYFWKVDGNDVEISAGLALVKGWHSREATLTLALYYAILFGYVTNIQF